MKVLIVAFDAAIREALTAQFGRRDRNYSCIGLEWFEQTAEQSSLNEFSVVVNLISVECLQSLADVSQLEHLSRLASACDSASIPLIHLSSGLVFGDFSDRRYGENDEVEPSCDVGSLMNKMEAAVRETCARHIILRTGPLFSARGDNFMTRLLRDFERHGVQSLSDTGKSCPLSTIDLARVISGIVDQISCGCEQWGTYHYASSDPASSFQFAETVLAVASQYTEVFDGPLGLKSIDVADSNWCSPLLNCSLILNTFGIKQLPWRAFVVPAVKLFFEDALSQNAKSKGAPPEAS